MNTLISVIMPVHNGADYIKTAIDSVLSQQVRLELIIIDDCSTDHLESVLAPYQSLENVHILHNEKNLGVAASRNKGVSYCKGKYVAFLDADDWWAPDKLRIQLSAMLKKKAVLSSTARELMNPDGTALGRIIPIAETITYKDLLTHNSLSCSGVMALRDVLLEFPMEHEDSHEDYITWMKIAKKYKFVAGINEPLLKYRLSEGSKSRNKIKSALMTFKAYRYAGLSLPASAFYFLSYMFHGLKKYYF